LIDLCGDELWGFYTEVEAVDFDIGSHDNLVTSTKHIEGRLHSLGFTVDGQLAWDDNLSNGSGVWERRKINGIGNLKGCFWVLIGVEELSAHVDVALFLIGGDVSHVDGNQTRDQGV